MKYRNIVVGCIILLVISFFIFKYFTKEITPNIVPDIKNKFDIGEVSIGTTCYFHGGEGPQIFFLNSMIEDMVKTVDKQCINKKDEVPLILILKDGKKEIYRGEVTYEKNAKRK